MPNAFIMHRRVSTGASALFFMVAVCGAAHCGHHHEHDGGAPTGTTCPNTSNLTYANFGKGFVQNHCLRCHSAGVTGDARKGAPNDHNLETLDNIRSNAEHIDGFAGAGPQATNTAMPPDEPRPSLEERRKLSEWLACGAPP